MSKRPKCQHGNPSIRMDGCAYCVTTAMHSMRMCQMLKVEPECLVNLLRATWKTKEAFAAALEAAARRAGGEEK